MVRVESCAADHGAEVFGIYLFQVPIYYRPVAGPPPFGDDGFGSIRA